MTKVTSILRLIVNIPVITKVTLTGTDIKKARENGVLKELLPSGANIPFMFADGVSNSFDVGRDDRHTYLIMHLSGIFQKLPDVFREIAVPLHIKQQTERGKYECDDRIFLLSATNVLGEDS